MKSRGVALGTLESRSGRVSSIPGTAWEGSLFLFPATGADDSAAPAGQVEGSVTTLPVRSGELQSLSFLSTQVSLQDCFRSMTCRAGFPESLTVGRLWVFSEAGFPLRRPVFLMGGQVIPGSAPSSARPLCHQPFCPTPGAPRLRRCHSGKHSPGWWGAVRQPTGSVFPCSPKQVKSPITGPFGTVSLSDSSLF